MNSWHAVLCLLVFTERVQRGFRGTAWVIVDHDLHADAERARKDKLGANECCIERGGDAPLLLMWRSDVVDMRCSWRWQSLVDQAHPFMDGCRP